MSKTLCPTKSRKKTIANLRMDRPRRLEAGERGMFKIMAFLDRFKI